VIVSPLDTTYGPINMAFTPVGIDPDPLEFLGLANTAPPPSASAPGLMVTTLATPVELKAMLALAFTNTLLLPFVRALPALTAIFVNWLPSPIK